MADSLNSFLSSVAQFDDWYGHVVDVLESAEKLEADEIAAKIEDIAAQRDERKANFESMLQNGKMLTAKKDVSDATAVREKIKGSINSINSFQFHNDRNSKKKKKILGKASWCFSYLSIDYDSNRFNQFN